MAVITKVLLVTHVTDLPVHSRHFTVALCEVQRMVIALIDNGFGLGLMTFGAHLVSRHLFGVLRRNGISGAHSGTGEKKNQTDT